MIWRTSRQVNGMALTALRATGRTVSVVPSRPPRAVIQAREETRRLREMFCALKVTLKGSPGCGT